MLLPDDRARQNAMSPSRIDGGANTVHLNHVNTLPARTHRHRRSRNHRHRRRERWHHGDRYRTRVERRGDRGMVVARQSRNHDPAQNVPEEIIKLEETDFENVADLFGPFPSEPRDNSSAAKAIASALRRFNNTMSASLMRYRNSSSPRGTTPAPSRSVKPTRSRLATSAPPSSLALLRQRENRTRNA